MTLRFSMIFVIILLLLTLSMSSCSSNETNNNISGSITKITQDGTFTQEECKSKSLSKKAIMLESKYCGHCQATLPDFARACDEAGIDCEILDLSKTEDYEQMLSYGVEVQYTPTFIFGCDYIVGVRSQEQYLSYLTTMK